MQTDISYGQIHIDLDPTDISLFERFSSESRGLSKEVNISKRAVLAETHYVPNDSSLPSSNDCIAIPLEASLPAKFPYGPSGSTMSRVKPRRLNSVSE